MRRVVQNLSVQENAATRTQLRALQANNYNAGIIIVVPNSRSQIQDSKAAVRKEEAKESAATDVLKG